jgi:hypothetical protein
MNRRDIVIGLIILAGLTALIYYWQRPSSEELQIPQTLSVEDTIEEMFNVEIPEDVEKAEMRDVSGGDASAVATRKYEEGKFTHSVLADLADPEPDTFYQGWLQRDEEGSESYSLISTGRLRTAKGGYLLEFESAADFSDHGKVMISSEKVDDGQMEEKVLEGSF